jgi:di/tricarboxylate transporter
MVLLLSTGAVPTVVAGLLAACAMVLLRVLKIEQAYRALNGTALIMIASLIPLSTAMYQTGAAALIADRLVEIAGSRSPYLLVAILFLMTTLLSQIISSSAAALITIPIATAAATEIGVSPRTALVSVAVGAAAAFLMPISSTVNLMVLGPGGYRFGDYWKLGLLLMVWFFAVTTVLVPLVWPF